MIAPALCKAMDFDAQEGPPGGWSAFYKLLLYCPGLPTDGDYQCASEAIQYYLADGGDDELGWWGLLGHVQSPACGFQTGPSVIKDLRLRKPFRKDVLFVTQLCQHDDSWSLWCACRGLIKNFRKSAIAKRSGALSYLRSGLQNRQRMQQKAKRLCIY